MTPDGAAGRHVTKRLCDSPRFAAIRRDRTTAVPPAVAVRSGDAAAAYIPGVVDVRVSDQQRERAAIELREHFAAGRLTQDEFDERVQQAYGARTEQQLRALLADLPRLPASPQEQKAAMVARRSQLQRRLLQETGGGVTLLGVCVAIWLIDGAQGQFWPVWVAIVVLIPLIRNVWRLYGPAPQFDRVERELERRAHRGGRHGRRSGRS